MDPSSYRAAEVLRDGTAVVLRAIRPDDKPRFLAAFKRLSPESIYNRFFGAKRRLSAADLRHLTELDFHDHVGLAVTIGAGPEERIIGVGRFVRIASGGEASRAEVAFTVADEFQGLGVATLLFQHLVPLARGLGIRTFEAEVLPANRQMLEVFEHGGLPLTARVQDRVTHVVITID